ncbi:MAG: hypothetical protein PVI23_13880 [Maricaulaceae bacterium]|jgi:hypothetical protein
MAYPLRRKFFAVGSQGAMPILEFSESAFGDAKFVRIRINGAGGVMAYFHEGRKTEVPQDQGLTLPIEAGGTLYLSNIANGVDVHGDWELVLG